jgi:hypothetical protein
LRGVSIGCDFIYQKALPALLEQHLRYGKARFKAHNSAFIFERGLSLSNAVMTGFDKTLQLQQSVKSVFEETTSFRVTINLFGKRTINVLLLELWYLKSLKSC